MGSSGRSRLGPAKRCGTALFGKPSAPCFCAVTAPRKRGSASGRNWYDSRGYRKPQSDWILALLISSGILGFGKKSRRCILFIGQMENLIVTSTVLLHFDNIVPAILQNLALPLR